MNIVSERKPDSLFQGGTRMFQLQGLTYGTMFALVDALEAAIYRAEESPEHVDAEALDSQRWMLGRVRAALDEARISDRAGQA